MEEMIEKFHHLLKPIRDLEQNWSVDIAEELTQALQSLSEQMITFGQHGDKIIDFSKAALIIQGSAHVYSKKVDYLYKTVYEMKEWMEKLWEVEKKSRGRSRTDGDGPDLNIEENEDDDLDLSYIKDDDTWLDEAHIQDQIDGSVLLPPKPMKIADTFHLKIPLKSTKGDIIGYTNEFLINTIDIDNVLSGTDMIPKALPQVAPSTSAHYDLGAPDDVDMSDDDHGLVDDMAPVCDAEMPPPQSSKLSCAISSQSETPVRADKQTRQLRPRNVKSAVQRKQHEMIIDPWSEILDPHSDSKRASKSLKPGNCRLLPPSLRKGTKRKQNGKRAAEKKTDDIATFCNKEYNQVSSSTGSNLLYPEFKSIFSDVLKKRSDDLRAIKKSRLPTSEGDEEGGDKLPAGGDKSDCDDNNNAEDCGNFDDEDDGIPFSRLQDTGDLPAYKEDDDLPAGYSTYLADVVKREYEDLASHNDKLTEIDKRVKLWENNVRGAIEIAETRPSFDMHHYSDSIFGSFSGDQDKIPFDKILEGKPKFEAFRTFVSALILANHGNIDIQEDNKEVQISLLNKTTLSDVIGAGDTL